MRTNTLSLHCFNAEAYRVDDAASWSPDVAPLEMPDQRLDAPRARGRCPPMPGLGRRRTALTAFCALSTGLAVLAVAAAMGRDGLTPLEVVHAGLILVLFGWMAFSFGSSLGGLWLSRRTDAWEHETATAPPPRPTTRTALLAPIYHEDVGPFFRRLGAMRARLHALGLAPFFDIVVLSDSRRAEVLAAEQAGFAAFRENQYSVVTLFQC